MIRVFLSLMFCSTAEAHWTSAEDDPRPEVLQESDKSLDSPIVEPAGNQVGGEAFTQNCKVGIIKTRSIQEEVPFARN